MDDEIYLSDLFAPVLARWKPVAVIALIGALVGLVVAIASPRLYESNATIYVQQSSASAGLLSSLPIASFGSFGSNPVAYYTTILDSSSLLRTTVVKLKLLEDRWFTEGKTIGMQEAIKSLRKRVKIKDNKSGRVDISARWSTADRSARIVNTMLDTLDKTVFVGSREKVDYLGQRLDETANALQKAEDKLRDFQEKTGVPVVQEEAKRVIEQMGALDAQLLTIDVALKAAESELANTGDLDALVQQEIRKRGMESSREYVLQRKEELMAGLGKLPEVALKYVRLERNVAVLTKIFQVLTERYQTAKIDEQGEGGSYQVIDRAEPADKPLPRGVVFKTLVGGFAGFLVAAVLVMSGARTRQRTGKGA